MNTNRLNRYVFMYKREPIDIKVDGDIAIPIYSEKYDVDEYNKLWIKTNKMIMVFHHFLINECLDNCGWIGYGDRIK